MPRLQANGKAAAPAIAEPPQWTWGVVQEGLESFSKTSGKSVEKILLAVSKQAAKERREAEEALDQGVGQLERTLVHDGTRLKSRVPFQGVGPPNEAAEIVRAGAGKSFGSEHCAVA